jgi:hypothetical protein
LASGLTVGEDDIPHIFHGDVWQMNIDLSTLTVSWESLPFENPPLVSQGGFHQFWRKNLTAFSWTAGLNRFNFTEFTGTCIGDQILTYDYKSRNFEITIPNGFPHWYNMSSGACGRFDQDIYCWGGFNCSTFEEPLLFTRYNIKENLLWDLSTAIGLDQMIPRDNPSVTCIEKEKKCLIGSGHLLAGGTVDEWNFYDIQTNSFQFIESKNKPTNIEYLSPDISQVWKIENHDFKVIEDKEILVTGGDNSSGTLLGSNTIRYLAQIDYKLQFSIQTPTNNLFTIKQQYLKNIPVVIKEKIDFKDKKRMDCSYFIEYGGKEQNEEVPYHYPNQVVLYTIC